MITVKVSLLYSNMMSLLIVEQSHYLLLVKTKWSQKPVEEMLWEKSSFLHWWSFSWDIITLQPTWWYGIYSQTPHHPSQIIIFHFSFIISISNFLYLFLFHLFIFPTLIMGEVAPFNSYIISVQANANSLINFSIKWICILLQQMSWMLLEFSTIVGVETW